MARHRRFSFEFKRQVVLDVLEERVGLREMARKHNISRSLIRQWIQKYETRQLTDELDEVRIAEYEGKIAELERKVGQLTMENDLLKKGARWARRPNDDTIHVEKETPARNLGRLVKVFGRKNRIPSNHIFRLGVGAVGHDCFGTHHRSPAFGQGSAARNLAGFGERGNPALEALRIILHLLGRKRRVDPLGTAIKI